MNVDRGSEEVSQRHPSVHGAMTVDLEDWRCALHPRRRMSRSNRPKMDRDYVASFTETILRTLREHESKATFFILGEVALELPDVVTEIHDRGHEIASHSSVHLPPRFLSRSDFSTLLARDVKLLEELTGEKPRGFRAPYFSVRRDDGWMLEVLAENRFLYDSSVVPTWTPYWGIPSAPKSPYIPSLSDLSKKAQNGSIMELPVTVWPAANHIPGLPVGGGFYMRAWPRKILLAMLWSNIRANSRLVLYVHPGNLDAEKEEIDVTSIRDIISQYFVAKRGADAFQDLLVQFKFGTLSSVFSNELKSVTVAGDPRSTVPDSTMDAVRLEP